MSKLLLIDDEADVQYSFRRIFDSPEIELTTAASGEEGLKIIPKLKPDLVIMDVRMGGITGLETLRRIRQMDSKLLVILMTAYGTTQTAIEAMKLGAYDYLLKPFDVPKLKEIIAGALKTARDMKAVVSYQPLLETEDYELGIVGRSESMQRVFKLIGQLAGSDATALITGESGTGKELVARAIYHHSERNGKPFLAINCAAIPEQLLESELFGHEKGAFTGATTQRVGRFEQCHQGTIFLDEIGDMTPATQTKILRVLQSGTFERVGGNEPIQVDVRVIAATNKPLEQAVAARQFREDVIQRAMVVAKGDVILPVDLPPEIADPGSAPSATVQLASAATGENGITELASLAKMLFRWARQDPKLKVLPAIERELIIQALQETSGNQVHAAKLLGITRATLRKRVEKFGIKRELNIT